MNNCKLCNSIIKKNNKFCSSSCAASYNNKKRTPRTTESKLRTSIKMKSLIADGIIPKGTPPKKAKLNPHSKLYGLYTCHNCNITFWRRARQQKCCSVECRDSIRSANKCRKTQIVFFNIFENSDVILQSKWELKIAEWLTNNNIKWIRPKQRIKWFDSTLNKNRTYLPDFYIPCIDKFLDVKNPIKMIEDADKLSQLIKIIPLFVGNIKQIIEFVGRLTGLEPACNPLAFS